MFTIASEGLPVLSLFESAFTTTATFARAKLLGVAALLTTGRRTVTNLLRSVASLTEGDPSSYHRVLSLAQWSGLTLAALLACFLLHHFWPRGRVRLVGDDTVPLAFKAINDPPAADRVLGAHQGMRWRMPEPPEAIRRRWLMRSMQTGAR